MQIPNSLAPFEQPLRKAGEWVSVVQQEIGLADPQVAYRALRGTLHALRDQLIPTESSNLAAQLPMLIRGLYFEGYRLTDAPDRIRHTEAFLARVARELVDRIDPEPAEAVRAVFTVLQNHVSSGEMSDVVHMLPSELQYLWPASPV
ncbi:MAG: DUF2267 domain-containing protein [Tepidisphaeraceae bacterium]